MTVPNFMPTAFSYQDLRREWGGGGGGGALSDKNTPGHN